MLNVKHKSSSVNDLIVTESDLIHPVTDLDLEKDVTRPIMLSWYCHNSKLLLKLENIKFLNLSTILVCI